MADELSKLHPRFLLRAVSGTVQAEYLTDQECDALRRWWTNGGQPPVIGLGAEIAVPSRLLLDLKDQIERDTVELESTTRWCRPLDKLIEQNGMPVAWEKLTALLKEHGL